MDFQISKNKILEIFYSLKNKNKENPTLKPKKDLTFMKSLTK